MSKGRLRILSASNGAALQLSHARMLVEAGVVLAAVARGPDAEQPLIASD
jgi:hypothetical protein